MIDTNLTSLNFEATICEYGEIMLASLLLDEDAVDDYLELMKDEYFKYDIRQLLVFNRIKKIHEEGGEINKKTVENRIKEDGYLELINILGEDYLKEIIDKIKDNIIEGDDEWDDYDEDDFEEEEELPVEDEEKTKTSGVDVDLDYYIMVLEEYTKAREELYGI